MRHCSKCGCPTTPRIPEGDHVFRAVCTACGHVTYVNPTVLVACILHEGERVLWIKRSADPYAGKWGLPGGFMECGETVNQAACRELREETRIRMAPDRLQVYGVFSIPVINQVYILLSAALPSRNFQITGEALDIKLLSAAEIREQDLAYPPSAWPLISDLYARLKAGTIARAPAVLADVQGVRFVEPPRPPLLRYASN